MTEAATRRVRPADAEDHERIVSLAQSFWWLTVYGAPFDHDHVLEMVRLADSHELLLVLEVDDCVQGFIAGVALPLLGNGSILQVTELAYWVNPDYRGHGQLLLDGLERAAKKRGARFINMIAMESSRPEIAATIYRNRGYRLIESTYCKHLEDPTWPWQPQ